MRDLPANLSGPLSPVSLKNPSFFGYFCFPFPLLDAEVKLWPTCQLPVPKKRRCFFFPSFSFPPPPSPNFLLLSSWELPPSMRLVTVVLFSNGLAFTLPLEIELQLLFYLLMVLTPPLGPPVTPPQSQSMEFFLKPVFLEVPQFVPFPNGVKVFPPCASLPQVVHQGELIRGFLAYPFRF